MTDLPNLEVTLVSVADLAKLRDWSRWTAWRYLCELERVHGSSVVVRVGPRRELHAFAHALAAIEERRQRAEIDGARLTDHQKIKKLEGQLKTMREEVAERDRRIDGLASEFSEFRRYAHEWFRRHGGAPGRP